MNPLEGPEDQSWDTLRSCALDPGGYDDLDGSGSGARRQVTWLRLLDACGSLDAPSPACSSRKPHTDERQVRLDVARSLTWDLGLSAEQLEARRAQLYEVIVCTLRSYPDLAYYQGYHDVVSVLLFTLAPVVPDEKVDWYRAEPVICWHGSTARWASYDEAARVKCATARMSLHVLRDHHAPTLGPSLDQVHLLGLAAKTQCSLAHWLTPSQGGEDEDQDETEPLFALSWLLTCFAHRLPDLQSAQRIMDAILAFGPRFGIWIGVSILIYRTQKLCQSSPTVFDDRAAKQQALQQLARTTCDSPTLESPFASTPSSSCNRTFPPDRTRAINSIDFDDLSGISSSDDDLPSFPSSLPSVSPTSSPRRRKYANRSLATKPSSLALICWGEPDDSFADPDVSLPDERLLALSSQPPIASSPPRRRHVRRGHHKRRKSRTSWSSLSSAAPAVPLSQVLSLARTLQLQHEHELDIEGVVGPKSVLLMWDRTLGSRHDRTEEADSDCHAINWAEQDAQALDLLRSLEPTTPPSVQPEVSHDTPEPQPSDPLPSTPPLAQLEAPTKVASSTLHPATRPTPLLYVTLTVAATAVLVRLVLWHVPLVTSYYSPGSECPVSS